MTFYLVSFIDNRTGEKTELQKFFTEMDAIKFCLTYAYYNNDRYINTQGEYIITKGRK